MTGVTKIAENARKTILVIDDSPEMLTIITAVLRDRYQLKVSKTGVRGLQLAQMQPQPDLILLDYLMPEMNGDDVCRQLKSNPLTSAIPVVFLTAASEQSTQTYLLACGAVDLISKPIDVALLINLVALYLNPPQSAS
jgi:putative two-component system response regulator